VRRLRLPLASAALVAAVVVCAGWATGHDGVILGQARSDTSCDTPADFVAAQTGTSAGASYTVPPGQWTITSWAAAGSSSGKEALVVFRPTGTQDEFRVVGSTPARELSRAKNMFTTRIKVKGGDLIGFWAEAGTICAFQTFDMSDTASIFFPSGIPDAGTTMTLIAGFAIGYRVNMKVTLQPRPPLD
jgi:hypothetical protein